MDDHPPEKLNHMLNSHLQRRLLESLSTAIVVLDSELVITYMNPAAEIMFETSLKRISNQPFEHLFFENENSEKELRQALSSAHPFTKREVSIRCNPLGQLESTLTVNYSVSVLQEPNSSPLLIIEFQALDRLLKISRDEALLANQQATKALLRGMAHEVKNPLGGIKGAAQLLLRELEDQEQHEYIHVVVDEVDRLRNLVDRMLGPRSIPNIQTHNLYEILEHVCHITEASSGQTIQIHKDYDPSIPDIKVDREQMIQASLNILNNAYQALSEHNIEEPKITIRSRIIRQFTIATRRHRMVVKVDFIDNGPGIPDDIKETLFYPMVSGRAQGTGLGLSIAQTIVNQFQGIIECTSEPGQTIFSLIIPLDADTQETAL